MVAGTLVAPARTVLVLREVYEYSVSETAVKLKTTEGAVKAALHRAHKVRNRWIRRKRNLNWLCRKTR